MVRQTRQADQDAVAVPLGYPTATIFVDESGSRASSSRFFVVAAAKCRKPGLLLRSIQTTRDRTGFKGEFKFSEITRGALPAYYDLVDRIVEADVHVVACVVNRDISDPFQVKKPTWRVHADVMSQLLVGCINRRELVGVLMDALTTPEGDALDETVRTMVNRRLKNTSVISATCLDSRCTDGLQVADLLAGAIAFERRRLSGENNTSPNSNKGKVAARLRAGLGVDNFEDQRAGRINIATYRASKARIVDLSSGTQRVTRASKGTVGV